MFKEVRGMDSAICKLAHDRYYYRECVWKVRFEESFCGWQARCSYYVSGDDSCYFYYVCVWENIFETIETSSVCQSTLIIQLSKPRSVFRMI